MANELVFYATPADTVVQLALDSGIVLKAGTSSANGRDDAHVLLLPHGTPGQGGVVTVTSDGRQTFRARGIVCPSDDGSPATFVFDDVGELPLPPSAPEPPPPPNPDANPVDIIETIADYDDTDLTTHDGCGAFTEDCCTALHTQHSADWGHIKKNPGQNQYNGHAIDALYLRWPAGDTKAGVYDIIHDSVSPNASPSFNWKDAGDPALWMPPV